jgi:hypothetical protein
MSEADDWTRTFLRWSDKRQVTIGFVNYPDEPPMEVWRFNLVDSELGADDVASELLRFTQDLEEGADFSLDVKRRYRSWGGDAAAFEVIIMVSSVILSHVAGPIIERKIEQLRRRMGDESPRMQPLNRDQAIRHAKYQVVLSYPVKNDDLSVESEEEDLQRNIWTVGLTASDNSYYIVEVGVVSGYPSTCRIRREAG